MREFFKSWRRKLGVVTLALACVFLTGWVRSWSQGDCLKIPVTQHSTVTFGSTNHLLGVSYETIDDSSEVEFEFWSDADARRIEDVISLNATTSSEIGDCQGLRWALRCADIVFAQSEYLPDWKSQYNLAVFPYWSIVVPLTVIAAWLLLVRSAARGNTEPTPQKLPERKPRICNNCRRKIGIVTLAMAFVFAIVWISSPWYGRFLAEVHCKRGEHGQIDRLFSLPSQIVWAQVRNLDAESPYNLSMSLSTGARPKYSALVFEVPFDWRWEWAGFRYADGLESDGSNACSLLFVPYWSIVLPLTLLSAWVLLSKPRLKPIRPTEPKVAPRDGADVVP